MNYIIRNTSQHNHLLDRPVWSSLTTSLHRFTQNTGKAYMMSPQFGQFAAAQSMSPEDQRDFVSLVNQQKNTAITMEAEEQRFDDLDLVMSAQGVQMIADTLRSPSDRFSFSMLNLTDAYDIFDLAELCNPGPFASESYLLGTFIGLRDNGRLIGMAGQRLSLPGYTEISAVCVAPDYRGNGLGADLVCTMGNMIQKTGNIPFLHAFASNTGAIELYSRLGFCVRRQMCFQKFTALDQEQV